VSLAGIGVSNKPVAAIRPASLDFGNVAILQAAMDDVFVRNDGTSPLTIDQLTITGNFFIQDKSQSCEFPIAPGSECWINIVFEPTSIGSQTGTLVIATNDGNGAYTVPLSGKGIAPLSNVLLNTSFESDVNGDTRPDSWSANKNVTRSTAAVHTGSYAMRHRASNNASYTVAQTTSNIRSGMAYTFLGYVNIPSTSDAFTFRIDIQWLDAKNRGLSTTTVSSYTGATQGWTQAQATLLAPANATKADVRMVVNSLSATVDVDDFILAPAGN
jgi:hypothetical protein